jgi:hypothetical protein
MKKVLYFLNIGDTEDVNIAMINKVIMAINFNEFQRI